VRLLVERLTGVRVGPWLLTTPMRAGVLLPWPSDLPSRTSGQFHGLRWSAPALLDVLAAASEATLWRVAVFAAERGAAAAGLDTLAPVAAALVRLRNGETATAGGNELDELVRQLGFASRAVGFAIISRQATAEERMAWRRAAAGEAVRHATNPDPLAAALDAVDRARLAFAVDDRADFCRAV
jgi:hypothetical protein